MTRIAVVTGASGGVGRAIAEALEGKGITVARVSRSSTSYPADVAQPDDVERLGRKIRGELGTPAILVNAAGTFGPIALVKDGDPRAWLETIAVNLGGPYLCCRAFLPGMLEEGWGRIVNISSAAAFHTPGPLNSAYASAKVALNQFTRHLAAEIEGSGVTANVIHPGEVKTEMWADIRDQAAVTEGADGYREWVESVGESGGDPPEKAGALVVRIVEGDMNGRFLWIQDPIQAPIPSWD